MTRPVEHYTSLSELFKIAFPQRTGRYFAVMDKVLDTFIDESSDKTQSQVLCVAAILANEKLYKPLEVEWLKRLHCEDITYFRANDCKTVHGGFEHLRKKYGSYGAAKKVADSVRSDLEDLLISSHWIGFCMGVIVPQYKVVLRTFPEATRCYAKDSTVAAFHQIMYEVVRTVRKKAKEFKVMFIVDDSTYSPRIRNAFEAIKINHLTIGTSAKGCVPLDDKDTPALQMADLFASVTKDIFLEWIRTGTRNPEVGKWYNHIERIGKFDGAVMLRTLTRTFGSPRFVKGTLARQFNRKPKITKGERKRMRRALWSKESHETRND